MSAARTATKSSASASASSLDATFAALADPTRRSVVELLRQEPRRAGDLAAALKVSPPALSRHLRVLRKSGLVVESGLETDARVRVYTLRRERFTDLASWLDEIEAFWTEQLGAFAAHVDQMNRSLSRSPKARPRPR